MLGYVDRIENILIKVLLYDEFGLNSGFKLLPGRSLRRCEQEARFFAAMDSRVWRRNQWPGIPTNEICHNKNAHA
jgi:hypothetical protein